MKVQTIISNMMKLQKETLEDFLLSCVKNDRDLQRHKLTFM